MIEEILTDEQKEIIHEINIGDGTLYAVESAAGSGKSDTIKKSLSQPEVPFRSALILAFNAKISKENKSIFPDWAECRTIHSLAYRYTVSPLGLKVKSNATSLDVKSGTKKTKEISISMLAKFCQSDHTTISGFLDELDIATEFKKVAERDIKQVIRDMESGKTEISHSVYIKIFQLHLVAGSINVDHYDFLFADEFQDFNKCMYSIFITLNADKKFVCGDSSQSIYGWAGATNAMQQIKQAEETTVLSLSQSFRCSTQIAEAVNVFCNSEMKTKMDFIGTHRSEADLLKLETFAHQFRTNREMIWAMMDCMENGIKFSLCRTVGAIFDKLIFVMIGAKKEYEYVKSNGSHSRNFKEENMMIYAEYLSYVAVKTGKIQFSHWLKKESKKDNSEVNDEILRIGSSASEFQTKDILELKKYCLDQSKRDPNFLLMSAHSGKGLSLDCVYIEEDLNSTVEKGIKELSDTGEEAELFLYYVACTRAKKCLINATALDGEYFGSNLNKDFFYNQVREMQNNTCPNGL